MKLRTCLGVVAVLMMLFGSAQAQSSRIAFVTDRATADDFDVWKMREDGSSPVAMTTEEGDSHHPSISLNGQRVVYDFGVDLWIMSHNGSGQTNLTASGEAPCNQYSTDTCADPDAGPLVGTDGDFRIVFTRKYPSQDYGGNPIVTEIWMATFDRSEGALDPESFTRLTAIHPSAQAQHHPAWCGSDHVAWSRSSEFAEFYEREICVLEVDANGPVGSPTCYWGAEGDGKEDQQPSCNSDGSKIAWARGNQYGTNDILVMDCVDLADCDTANAINLSADLHDEIHPSWSPSGTMIAFATDRGAGADYDIFQMNAADGTEKTPLTDSSEEDNEPDWGAGTLP